MTKINLTPIFEHVFGVSEIDNKEHLQALSEALREVGGKPLFEKDTLDEIKKLVEAKLEAMANFSLVYTPLLHKAFHFSILVHEVEQKQKRKGKDVAYVTHPIQVGFLLAKAGASDEVVAAGFLHDTLEDSADEAKVTKEDLIEEFGQEVADLVGAVTEKNKSLPWDKRKAAALEEIKQFSNDALLVKSGDVLSNVSELLSDFYHDADKTFERFNAPKKKIIAHAQEVIETILEKWPENPLAADLNNCYLGLEDIKEFHVTYKYKEPENEMERKIQEENAKRAYRVVIEATLRHIREKEQNDNK